MTKDEISKLPTPETNSCYYVGGDWSTANLWSVSRSLEKRLAAAVMALETILMHERKMLWPNQRETLAAIKGGD